MPVFIAVIMVMIVIVIVVMVMMMVTVAVMVIMIMMIVTVLMMILVMMVVIVMMFMSVFMIVVMVVSVIMMVMAFLPSKMFGRHKPFPFAFLDSAYSTHINKQDGFVYRLVPPYGTFTFTFPRSVSGSRHTSSALTMSAPTDRIKLDTYVPVMSYKRPGKKEPAAAPN